MSAAGAGLLSFLSPCVLPLVPPYLGFLAGVSLGDLAQNDGVAEARPNWRVVALSFAFVLGFAKVFIALGASASLIGKVMTARFETLGIVAGLVIVVFGLHFLGLFRISLLFREARMHAASRDASYAGAYVMGLAFAFGWTPCVGPVLASSLVAIEKVIGEALVLTGVLFLTGGMPQIAGWLLQTFPFIGAIG